MSALLSVTRHPPVAEHPGLRAAMTRNRQRDEKPEEKLHPTRWNLSPAPRSPRRVVAHRGDHDGAVVGKRRRRSCRRSHHEGHCRAAGPRSCPARRELRESQPSPNILRSQTQPPRAGQEGSVRPRERDLAAVKGRHRCSLPSPARCRLARLVRTHPCTQTRPGPGPSGTPRGSPGSSSKATRPSKQHGKFARIDQPGQRQQTRGQRESDTCTHRRTKKQCHDASTAKSGGTARATSGDGGLPLPGAARWQ